MVDVIINLVAYLVQKLQTLFNSGSMRQGDHFSQTKKKSEKPVIDTIDFK